MSKIQFLYSIEDIQLTNLNRLQETVCFSQGPIGRQEGSKTKVNHVKNAQEPKIGISKPHLFTPKKFIYNE